MSRYSGGLLILHRGLQVEFIPKGSWDHSALHPQALCEQSSFLWSSRGYLEFMSCFSPCEQTKQFLWVILPANCQGKVWLTNALHFWQVRGFPKQSCCFMFSNSTCSRPGTSANSSVDESLWEIAFPGLLGLTAPGNESIFTTSLNSKIRNHYLLRGKTFGSTLR